MCSLIEQDKVNQMMAAAEEQLWELYNDRYEDIPDEILAKEDYAGLKLVVNHEVKQTAPQGKLVLV